MNKYDKIIALRSLDLNTEDSVLISTRNDKNPYNGHISIRTQWRDANNTAKTPHYAWVKAEEFPKYRDALLQKNLELIVAQGINPEDARFAGCIMRKDNIYVVEIAEGPGTARRVTHQGLIDQRFVTSAFLPRTPRSDVNEAIRKIEKADHDYGLFENFLFEFSYYNKPVGYKHENVIFWEYYKTTG